MDDITKKGDELNKLQTIVYEKRNANITYWNKLRVGDIKCYQLENQPKFVPPVAFREVKKAIAQIATGYPIVTVVPNNTQDEKKSADKIRDLYDMCYQSSCDYNGPDIDNETAEYIAISGGGVKKLIYMPEYECKFIWVPINPLHFFPDPSGKFQYEVYEMFVGEIKEKINVLNEGLDKKPWATEWMHSAVYEDDYSKAFWIERWSDLKRQFFISHLDSGSFSNLSEEQDNKFKKTPYVWSTVGRGRNSLPEDQWIGVLSNREQLFEALARGMTALDFHLRYNVYPELWVDEDQMEYFATPETPSQHRPVSKDILEGNGAMLRPELNINRDFYSYINILQDFIIDLGGDPALMGEAGSDASGRRFEGQVMQASLHYVTYRKTLEVVNSKAATLLTHVASLPFYNKDGIPLGGKSKLTVSDIRPHTRVKVEMEVKNPAYDQNMVELGLRLYERSVVTLQELREDYMKLPDSANAIGRIVGERIMREDQTMASLAVIEAYEEQGMDEEANQMRMAMNAQTGQNAASNTQTIDPRAIPQMQGPSGAGPVNPMNAAAGGVQVE